MPSTKAIMTGIHPYLGGLKKGIQGRTILPEIFKKEGYKTALIGKWHLKDKPNNRGFDLCYGTIGSNDVSAPKGKRQNYTTFKETTPTEFPVKMLLNGEPIHEFSVDQRLFTQRYTKAVQKFITDSGDSLFFIYYANNMPHAPIFASENFQGKSTAGLYGDVIEELDWSVGQIVKTLKEKGLYENTIIIYTPTMVPGLCSANLAAQQNLYVEKKHSLGRRTQSSLYNPLVW